MAVGTVIIGAAQPGLGSPEPTGDVTVNAPTGNPSGQGIAVVVFGGANVTINDAGGGIKVGNIDNATSPVFAPTGDVTITDTALSALAVNYLTGAVSGVEADVSVVGGNNVTVTTNTGGVFVGNEFVNGTIVAGQNPIGDVTVNENSNQSDVTVFGAGAAGAGGNVTVNAVGGGVTIGATKGNQVIAPIGDIAVVDQASLPYDGVINTIRGDVTTLGGATVSVQSNAGGISIGQADGLSGSEPTGNVTATDTATAANFNDGYGPHGAESSPDLSVQAYGGVNVVVNAAGQWVQVGADDGTTAAEPTGTVAVTQAAVDTGYQYNTFVDVAAAGGAVTVNTTGGGVAVGDGVPIPGTAAVTVNDTFAGPSTSASPDAGPESVSVNGGSTVAINTTATRGDILVGDVAPKLDTAGTALANAASYATGNVTIVNETVAGSTPAAGATNVFGTGDTVVRTNGATQVSIAGGGDAEITDMQTTKATGGPNANKAIGPSTLATVLLDGVGGGGGVDVVLPGPAIGTPNVVITSDVLASLTVADSAKGAATVAYVAETPAHALAVTLSNDATGTSVEDDTATSITVSDTGTASNSLILNAAKATGATFSNAAALTVTASSLPAVQTVTGNGSGNLSLGDLSLDSSLKTVDVSGTTGGTVSVTLDPAVTSFKGGPGTDTVTLISETFGSGVTVAAGGGSNNEIIADYFGDLAVSLGTTVHNFSVLGVQGSAAFGTFDATGFSGLVAGNLAAPGNNFVNFIHAGAGTSLALTNGNEPIFVGYSMLDKTAGSDSLPLTLGVDGAKGTNGVTDTLSLFNESSGVVTKVSVDSLGLTVGTTFAPNSLTITDDQVNSSGNGGVKSISISGHTALDLSYHNSTGSSSVATIDASAATGKVDVSDVWVSPKGVTITGGSALLTASGAATGADNTAAIDKYTAGSGGSHITVGYGGSWNSSLPNLNPPPALPLGNYDVGSETVNMQANVTDTVVNLAGSTVTFNGVTGGITGFQATSGNADVISMFGAHNVIANVSGTPVSLSVFSPAFNVDLQTMGGLALVNQINTLAYVSSNGVITFSSTGGGLSGYSDATLRAAGQLVVTDLAESTGTEQIALFQTPTGNSFVVASDWDSGGFNPGHLYGSAVDELMGVTGLTGFGITDATNVLDTQNVTLLNAGHTGASTPPGAIYDDTGFSADNLSLGAHGVTNAYTNLGGSAELFVTGSGDLGNVAVSQTGASGGDSLTVSFLGGGSTTLGSLSTTNDDALYINVASSATLGSVSDTTNTTTQITITGGADLTIKGVTDTALTNIDAHTDTGALTLTASQGGLTILGALGGDTITANGVGDTIKVGDATHSFTGDVSVVANGANDVITLTNGDPGNDNMIAATSNGDVITVDNGDNSIAGTFDSSGKPIHALGNTDMVNLHASFGAFERGVGDVVWVGSGNTVNLGTPNPDGTVTAFGANGHDDSASVKVTGALAGGTTTAGFSQTTITGADKLGVGANDGSLQLVFENQNSQLNPLNEFWAGHGGHEDGNSTEIGNSLVNMAGVTSLNQAIDQAINWASIIDSQHGGGETTVSNGQVLENPNTGLLTWFQFGGNTYITEAINASTQPSGAAAHTALAAGDAVVELTGLIDLTQGHIGFTLGGHPV